MCVCVCVCACAVCWLHCFQSQTGTRWNVCKRMQSKGSEMNIKHPECCISTAQPMWHHQRFFARIALCQLKSHAGCGREAYFWSAKFTSHLGIISAWLKVHSPSQIATVSSIGGMLRVMVSDTIIESFLSLQTARVPTATAFSTISYSCKKLEKLLFCSHYHWFVL